MKGLFQSSRFVIVMYVDTCVFIILALEVLPAAAHENGFWWFMTALNGGMAASKIAEKFKSSAK